MEVPQILPIIDQGQHKQGQIYLVVLEVVTPPIFLCHLVKFALIP